MHKAKNIKTLYAMLLAMIMLFAAVPVFSATSASSVYAEFYIDPINGSDSNNGSKEAPFATIKKATEAVKAEHNKMTGDIYVWFADGRYELSETVRFDKKTGGRGDYNVYYQALPGAKPVISGGKEITDWELYDSEKNIYRAKTGGIYSRHFVVDGERAKRARSEKNYWIDPQLDYGVEGMTCGNVEMLTWENKEDIELTFFRKFYYSRLFVNHIRPVSKDRVMVAIERWNVGPVNAYIVPTYIENAYEVLDEEGEWYINRRTNYVYYKPKEGQDMNTVNTVIPVLEDLFYVGGYDYHAKTENIVFRGLTFRDTTWMHPTDFRVFRSGQNSFVKNVSAAQNSWLQYDTAAVTFEKAKDISFEENIIYALGNTGIRIIEGSEKLNIVGNHIYDTGSSAMVVGSVRDTELYPKDERRMVRDISVTNNYMHHNSQDMVVRGAITVGYPRNLHLRHNELHDCPYSGLHVGWGWGGMKQKALEGFVLEYNYIHDYMKGWGTVDGGGIYCLGYTSDKNWENKNQIVRNYFKDNYTRSDTAGGNIYLDNTSSHYLIEGNVIDNRVGSKIGGADAKPFAMTTYTPIDNIFRDNFATASFDRYVDREKEYIYYSNNQYHPTANWPKAARDVISKAGLEEEYRHLSPRSNEFARVFTIENVNIVEGQTYQLVPTIATEFCEELSMDGAQVSYESLNDDIVSVSQAGLITALKNGIGKVNTNVTKDGVTHTAQTTVAIGEGLASVYNASRTPHKLVKGETKPFPEIRGREYSGNDIPGTLENVTFKSSNPDVLFVDEVSRTITAKEYGEAILTYSGEYKGTTQSVDHKIEVIPYGGDPAALNYPTIDVTEMFESTENWSTNSGNMYEGVNKISFEQTDLAIFNGNTYGDGLFDFEMSLDQQAMWPGFCFRNTYNEGITENNSFYLICFANSGIELQRYNGEVRTSLYCNLLPNERIGPTHPMILEAGRTYHVQAGAFTEEDGVRIILNIDGVNIMNYLDEAENRIEDEGYFGLRVNKTTMNLAPAK